MRAVDEATQATFNDDVVRDKMREAVLNSFCKVFNDEPLSDSGQEEAWSIEQKRYLTQSWIKTTMQQAWASVENSETVLTPENISKLFQKLLGPSAQAYEYSCIEQLFRSRREGGPNRRQTSKRRMEAGASHDAEPIMMHHPECKSEEDCIGNPTDNLVQHMLGGDLGDTYCVTCWRSFLPFVCPAGRMEAVWKNGDHAGQIFMA